MKKEDGNSVVRFAAFEMEYEAVLLKTALEENGIDAWVTGGDGVNMFGAGLTTSGLVGVDVRIRRKDLDAAIAIRSRMKKDLYAMPTPAWTCKCGERIDEGFAICWSCGDSFDERVREF